MCCYTMFSAQPRSTLFPYTTLFRSLFCANCNLFRDRIEALVETAPKPVTAVVVDCGAIHDVDIMACEMLRSEEHTSELQSHVNLVCRLLLEKKKIHNI